MAHGKARRRHRLLTSVTCPIHRAFSQFDAAFAAVQEYINTTTGASNGPSLPPGYDASSVLMNTLGDILAGCVNSTGGHSGDNTACGTLFTLTTPSGGPAPTDTIGAALQILKNPTNISPALLGLVTSNSPYQPTLTSAPATWAPAIIPVTTAPAFSPAGGNFSATQAVTLTDVTAGSTIYYTTDGSTPTTSSSVYSGALTVSATQTLKAIATAPSYATSGVSTATYTFGLPVAPAPTFSIPNGAPISAPQSLLLFSSVSGATIYYTTDGSTPTTSSRVFNGSILVGQTETVSAMVAAPGYSNSPVATASYTYTAYGVIQTIAGNGSTGYAGDGSSPLSAELTFPEAGLIDPSGNIFIADRSNNVVRKITAGSSPIISTYAGTGTAGYTGDGGPATSAEIANITGIALDQSGNLYLSDETNSVIRKVTPAGIISTFADTGVPGYSGDGGPATSAQLNGPYGLAIDGAGNLYISDLSNSRVRVVTPYGVISTFAGVGTAAFSGDGGQASAAHISSPYGLAFDQSGNLYIADFGNARVRKVTPAGIISTFAGNGSTGYSAADNGGPATSAKLGYGVGLAFDPAGNLYIAQYLNAVVRKVTPAGIISLAAGTAVQSFGGDGGPATSAQLDYPIGVFTDPSGDLYIADARNSRIREVTYQTTPPQAAPTFSPVAGNYSTAQTVTITPAVSGAAIYYTLDGTKPTVNSAQYMGPITVSSAETISAISVATGYTNSAIATCAYQIVPPAATPTFSPQGGTFGASFSVIITSATPNATIYYTTNGNPNPTTSSNLYNGPITVSASETINAIAVAPTASTSAVGTAVYIVD